MCRHYPKPAVPSFSLVSRVREVFDRHVMVVGWVGVTESLPSMALRKPTHQHKRLTFNRWVGVTESIPSMALRKPTHQHKRQPTLLGCSVGSPGQARGPAATDNCQASPTGPCEVFDRHVMVVGWVGVTESIPSMALRKPTHQHKRQPTLLFCLEQWLESQRLDDRIGILNREGR